MATLLVDADDTLWENITVFHGINARYAQWIAPDRDPVVVRRELDQIQVSLVKTIGYGRNTFRQSLLRGIEHFVGRSPTDDDEAIVRELVRPLQWEELDLIEGVRETLDALCSAHQLFLVTKGDHEEQSQKVKRSGLGPFFEAVEILDTKSVAEYERLIAHHQLDPDLTWMIGNSPRSDIVPALDAGLHAVFIPHEETWGHELEDVPDHPRLTQLTRFTELLTLFA